MSQKKNATYSIDETVKTSFKAECAMNSVDMSQTIEDFQSKYVKISRQLRNQQDG